MAANSSSSKRRKFCKLKPQPSLPSFKEKPVGHFNNFNVIVKGDETIKTFISMGYFGKANLSRNYPQFSNIIRSRQFQNRRKFDCGKVDKVIVTPDSDSDEDFFTNLQPKYEIDKSGLNENLQLMLEEAYFLSYAIDCLNIEHDEKILTKKEAWELFKEVDEFFVGNYVVYYHFRAKNWVVKIGIKFGGDYLLYQQGPPFYHAAYVVVIEEAGAGHKIRRDLNVINLMGLQRLCETAGKELLICNLSHPDEPTSDLTKFTVNEVVMKRWLPSQERN